MTALVKIINETEDESPLYKLCAAAKDEVEAIHKTNPAVAEAVVQMINAATVLLDAVPTLVAIDQLVSLIIAVAGNSENRSAEQGDAFPAFPQQQFIDLFMDELPRRHKAHLKILADREAARKAQFAQFAKAFNLDPETGQPLTPEQIEASNEAAVATQEGQLLN